MLTAKQNTYDKLKSLPVCPICGEVITRSEVGMCEMIKTKRRTTVFVHKLCLKTKTSSLYGSMVGEEETK